MSRTYISDQTFEDIDFSQVEIEDANYDQCTFIRCHFKDVDLSDRVFIDCVMKECDLSLASLTETAFREVVFENCKMMGLHFEDCNSMGLAMRFDSCQLDHSSFYGVKMKDGWMKNSSLKEVDFTEADLVGLVLEDCELKGATFEQTKLEKADLRTARNFEIDPRENRLKKARFAKDNLEGLLNAFGLLIE